VEEASEGSELDQRLLCEQDSDQNLSDEEAQRRREDVFAEGSDDTEVMQVCNPILFTEHVPIIGRVPLRKCFDPT